MTRTLAFLATTLLVGCAPMTPSPHAPAGPIETKAGIVRAGTPDAVNIANAREKHRERAFEWMPFAPETFARAKRENKKILLDGAAEWCHWCHVMDETTYLDPEIGKIIHDRFIAIRIDVDERPDLAERYGEWGWPATILMSPDAEELGKFRGYMPAEELKAALDELERGASEDEDSRPDRFAADRAATVDSLPWVAARVTRDLDSYYDAKEGSWGHGQKSPLGADAEFELRRGAHGNPEATKRALFSLEKERALIDPVWGGVYQYSAGKDWNHPHYEKLMTYQAENLEAYALAYAASKDAGFLSDANKIASYLNTFLSNKDGAFLVTQDADSGAHDHGAKFVDGDVYYRLDDAHRRALGIPRVDDHVYAHENGLGIAAFVTFAKATGDAGALPRARRAADLLLKTAVDSDGSVKRGESRVRFLADAAALGRALAMLADATKDPGYKDAAVKIAAAMERDFGGGDLLFAHTVDPGAAGVFKHREQPFVHNVTAARFLAALSNLTGDAAYRARAQKILAGLATPRRLDERGRMVGHYLLALDEVGSFGW